MSESAHLAARNVLLATRGMVLACILAAGGLRASLARAQAATAVQISSPTDGEALQGSVEIMGTLSGPAFLSGQLAFAYARGPSDTWFVIADIHEPVENGPIATWNTSEISDGDYRLRLQLNMLDGTSSDAFIDVQVRNYTAPVQLTPAQVPTTPPVLQVATPMIIATTPTAGLIEELTPTPLPGNAAALSTGAVFGGLWRGALAVIAVCVIVGVLLLRRRS